MKIEGLQKLTLLDYPEKVACTVFTGGCNLRCPFCHNASLVLEDRGNLVPIASQKQGTHTEEEILKFLKKRKGVLDGICITGGEPLIQKGLAEFIKKIKELGYLVKLDTNGTFPERLEELVNAGLVNYVAMDIKNSRELYPVTVGMPEFDTGPVEESVRFLMERKVPYEFRTTVVREFHTEESLRDTGIWIAGSAKYRLQQFVDSGDIIHPGLHAWEPETLHKWADMLKTYVSDTEVRGTE